jgi:Na+-translocating ferredoxin:NAD+ oxidoreductase RNF subunit RnfB
MQIVLISLGILFTIAALAAVILFVVAKKFYVKEDERIDVIAEILPGANCGGCGFPGCRGLAEAICKANSLEGKFCPVGGAATMEKIAPILGVEPVTEKPKVAVVRCNGSKINSPRNIEFDGLQSCRFSYNLYTGVNCCPNGCVGLGDCTRLCQFDAIHICEETGLPVVDEEKCVACGKCADVCPRGVIQLRYRGPKDRKIWVQCVNKEQGALARKHCKVACIACGKCQKECQFGAITIDNNVAYIDFIKCRLCRKCVAVCPTTAIKELNFPEGKSE